MRADARAVAEKLALAAALMSIGYAAFALTRVRAFGRRLRARQSSTPPVAQPPEALSALAAATGSNVAEPSVTVLKPVHGVEPRLEENLRSFCEQDYPRFDVVIGVHDADDPALEVARRVAAAFPDRTRVVVGDGVARYRNPKIANVARMLMHARGEILVIADSDMRVSPEYLAAVTAPFDHPSVGAVTAIYRGEPADDALASALGAMWITEQFAPSVLVATALEPLTYTFGATMAVRRATLDAIGGLDALGDNLADDHALGALVARHGGRVALARYVVTNVVAERGLRELVRHEIRWARTIRAVRPASYPGILLTYPVPLALLHLALARRKNPAAAVLAVAAALRLALHATAHRALDTRAPAAGALHARPAPPAGALDARVAPAAAAFHAHVAPAAALVPLRDALGVVVWAFGLFGRGVRWQDTDLTIAAHGKLSSAAE